MARNIFATPGIERRVCSLELQVPWTARTAICLSKHIFSTMPSQQKDN